MFWDWEVLLSDSTAVPLSKINKNIDYKSFEGKKVLVSGNIFYGTIIGGKHEYEQSATGYRIDATEIKKLD
ncbi:MAG: hypothetical protein K0S33_3652 [Bacteroidetes bacterium]|nr:hypothetical protein [Bacteroidota bacterium]